MATWSVSASDYWSPRVLTKTAIQRFVEEVETTGRDRFGPTSWIFSGSEWGPHIKGLGRAPSVCFNEGFVRPDVLDAVNEWGAATWPGFVRASAASNAE